MTDVARVFREELARRAVFGRLGVEEVREAADGCRKFLFGLADGNLIESVLIPEEGHLTLCLSTQVGCAQGCRFPHRPARPDASVDCRRNRRPGHGGGRGLPADGPPLSNLVFMGMGEALAKVDQVVKALTIIAASWGLNFSTRRLTVSTVGLAPLIPRLGLEARANLTVSLNPRMTKPATTSCPLTGAIPWPSF